MKMGIGVRATLVALLFLAAPGGTLKAAEVNVLGSNAMIVALKAMANEFERTSGHKLTFTFGSAGQVKSRVEAGDAVDVAISTGPAIDDLIKQGKIAAEGRTVVAKVGLGVAVRSGAPKPDISTPDAFKKTLLAAKSIGRPDPAQAGAAGVYIAKMLEQLGIAEEVKAKSKLSAGPAIAGNIAKGEADIGITQMSELVTQPGVDIVGPFPRELQNVTVFAAGVSANAKERDAANAFIKFLMTPAAAEEIKKTGMEPG
jgi:molybdate transport system substrate-binding protein